MGNYSFKQLEAEVIDVQDDTVLIHYNGWAHRWDELLHMNSNRIAPFRTYTVPNAYSVFMSPNPSQALDGMREGSTLLIAENRPDVVPFPEDIMEETIGNLNYITTKMTRLLYVKKQREDQMKMIELFKAKSKEKGGRYSLKGKSQPPVRLNKIIQVKKDQHRSNQKEIYGKNLFN